MITKEVDSLIGRAGAVFSDCGTYRYRLWREWNFDLPNATFIMMNPSTADEIVNDPTVERQQRRVMKWGGQGMHIGRIEVVNVFAYRETYSDRLPELHKSGFDLIGPGNDDMILDACRGAAIVVCGWGAPGMLGNRGNDIVTLLRANGIVPHALQMNADGSPRHPLYVAYNQAPFPIHPDDRKTA